MPTCSLLLQTISVVGIALTGLEVADTLGAGLPGRCWALLRYGDHTVVQSILLETSLV